MAGQITVTQNRGISGISTPLSGRYSQVGSVFQSYNSNVPAGSSVLPLTLSWLAAGTTSGDLVSAFFLASQNCTLQTNGNGTIGVQTLTMTGTPTGGTFILAYQGAITADLAFNISASSLQTALRALSTIGGTNVTCTGGPFPGSAITCTFSGALVNATVPLITFNVAGLTGGSPVLTIANAASVPQDVIPLAANIPLAWDVSCGAPCPFLGAVTNVFVTNVNSLQMQAGILTY